jgi:hypothetical protein
MCNCVFNILGGNVTKLCWLQKKNGNCQNKIDTFLQFFHSVKPSYESRLELTSKFNDIFKNYLISIVK